MTEFCHDTCPLYIHVPVMFVFQMKEFCHVTCPLILTGDVSVSDEVVLSCNMKIVH